MLGVFSATWEGDGTTALATVIDGNPGFDKLLHRFPGLKPFKSFQCLNRVLCLCATHIYLSWPDPLWIKQVHHVIQDLNILHFFTHTHRNQTRLGCTNENMSLVNCVLKLIIKTMIWVKSWNVEWVLVFNDSRHLIFYTKHFTCTMSHM